MLKSDLSRREILQRGVALPFAVRALAEPHADAHWILLGSNHGEGVYRAPWYSATGTLGEIELAAATAQPTWLAVHPTLPVLYAANESDHSRAGVSAFMIGKDAALTPRQSLRGDAPCFVAVLPGAERLVEACYGAGTVGVRHLNVNGDLHDDDQWRGDDAAHGPNTQRQGSSHPHCGTVTPDGRHMIVCDLGCDTIDIFRLENEGAPFFEKFTSLPTKPGSGPRHVAFHANGKWMYVIHELSCTLELYDWDGEVATLRADSTVGTMDAAPSVGADGFADGASEVAVLGNHLYAATRGVDLLDVFEIDHKLGTLKRIQQIPSGGRIPRHFALSTDGRWMVVANQGSAVAGTANVAVFRRSPDGRLKFEKTYPAESPMFVQFI